MRKKTHPHESLKISLARQAALPPCDANCLSGTTAGHFLGNEQSTLFCANADPNPPRVPDTLHIKYDCGWVKNIQSEKEPNKQFPATAKTGFVLSHHKALQPHTVDIPNEFKLTGDLRDDVKRMSIIFPANRGHEAIKGQLIHFLRSHTLSDKLADKIVDMAKPNTEFVLEPYTDIRSYRSSHYTTHFAIVKGTYTDTDQARILAQRTVILAELRLAKTTRGQRTHLVPLGEELTIQIQTREATQKATFLDHGFVITAKPIIGVSESHLHFIGNNAMSISIPNDQVHQIRQDGYTATARMAAWLIQNLKHTTSHISNNTTQANAFFKTLLTESLTNYYLAQLQYESGNTSGDVLRRSFLSKQHAHDFSRSTKPKYCVRQWSASVGLGMLVLSPNSAPDKNYVFVWARTIDAGGQTYTAQPAPLYPEPEYLPPQEPDVETDSTEEEELPQYPRRPPKYLPPLKRNELTDPPGGPAEAPLDLKFRSHLPPELELELELL